MRSLQILGMLGALALGGCLAPAHASTPDPADEPALGQSTSELASPAVVNPPQACSVVGDDRLCCPYPQGCGCLGDQVCQANGFWSLCNDASRIGQPCI
jgi:hypothetical protein